MISRMILNKKYFFLEVVLVFIGLALSYYMIRTQNVHQDNIQIMDKAMALLNEGRWTHYGNDTSKMGSLPGSFLTAITAGPMFLWKSPMAAGVVILIFHLLSYLILRNIGLTYFENFQPLYLVIFYWLNPWRVEQSELYNPAYLYLFSALYFLCIYKLKEQSNFFYSFLLVVSLGFCMQVHLSVLILGVSFLFLYLTKKIKFNYWGAFIGLLVIAASLIPWYQALMQNKMHSLHTQADGFIGKNFMLVYPVIKAILYFFRMTSTYCGTHIFSEVKFNWLENEILAKGAYYLFLVLLVIVALYTMYLAYQFLKPYLRQALQFKKYKELPFFHLVILSLFWGVIISAGLSPIEFTHWHLILAFPILSFAVAAFPEQYFQKNWKANKNKILTFTILFFIIWNLFVAMGSHSHNYNNNYEQQIFERYGIH